MTYIRVVLRVEAVHDLRVGQGVSVHDLNLR